MGRVVCPFLERGGNLFLEKGRIPLYQEGSFSHSKKGRSPCYTGKIHPQLERKSLAEEHFSLCEIRSTRPLHG
jgi:hypothetical protein